MAGEIGKLEIGAKINRQQLQGDIRDIERDLGKIRAQGEQTTASIERIGKAGAIAGAGLIGMATAGVAAFSNLTKGSPALVGEHVQQQIAQTQIGLQGGGITLPIEKIKTSLIKSLAGLVQNSPEKLSGLFGLGTLAGGVGIAGGALSGLGALLGGSSAGGLAALLAGAGTSTLAGGGVGLLGGLGGTGLNALTDLLGITNKNDMGGGSTIGRFSSQALGGAATGAIAGSIVPGLGTGIGAIVGAIGGLISAGFQEFNIRNNSNPQNRKYDETRQEYVI